MSVNVNYTEKFEEELKDICSRYVFNDDYSLFADEIDSFCIRCPVSAEFLNQKLTTFLNGDVLEKFMSSYYKNKYESSMSKRLKRSRITRHLSMAARAKVPDSCKYTFISDSGQSNPYAANKTIEKLAAEKSELAVKLVETETSMHSLEHDVTSVNNVNRKLSTDVEQLKETITYYKELVEKNDQSAMINNIQTQYAEIKKELKKIKKEKSVLEDQFCNLKLEYDVLNEEKNKKIIKLDDASKEILDLKKQLIVIETENFELMQFFETHKKEEDEKNQLLNRIERLEIANSSLKIQLLLNEDFSPDLRNESECGLNPSIQSEILEVERFLKNGPNSNSANLSNETKAEYEDFSNVNDKLIAPNLSINSQTANLSVSSSPNLNEDNYDLDTCDMELCTPSKESANVSFRDVISEGSWNENIPFNITANDIFGEVKSEAIDIKTPCSSFPENHNMRNVVIRRRKLDFTQVEYSPSIDESVKCNSSIFFVYLVIFFNILFRFVITLDYSRQLCHFNIFNFIFYLGCNSWRGISPILYKMLLIFFRFIIKSAKVFIVVLLALLCVILGFVGSAFILNLNLKDYSYSILRISYPNGPPPT